MESLVNDWLALNDFVLINKDRSVDARSRWRRAFNMVKNPRRRFRYVADLEKRKEARNKLQKTQEAIKASFRTHEVFLSFRGEDTRASFISHLHSSLQNAGIDVFIDDHSLERGHHISTSLLRAIEDSQISIVVFSTNYADSRWCLQELEKIMQWRRTRGQVVVPVFYNVDPSEVRHQTGEFGNAFQNLLNRIPEKEHKQLSKEERDESSFREYCEPRWRAALRDAAGLAGFVVLNSRIWMSMVTVIQIG